jgi:hypothetical protein
MTLFEQLGNIGSEVGRTFKTVEPDQKQATAYRALELFDLTLADKRWRGRGSELARSREVFCDFVFGDNQYNSDAAGLEKYFMQFAIAARLQR